MHTIRALDRALVHVPILLLSQLKSYENEIPYYVTNDKFMALMTGQLKASSTSTKEKTLF